jgi:hypothetical protein
MVWGFGLTLIPPSGGLYGSQFLVMKLLKIHKCYEYETIIYSSSFLGYFIIYISKIDGKPSFLSFFYFRTSKA